MRNSIRYTFALLSAVAVIMLARPILRMLNQDELAAWLLLEDGVIENVSTLLLVAAAGTLLVAGTRSKGRSNRRVRWTLWAFALLLFLGFAEEIDWGQRIFRYGVPESLAQQFEPGEVSLHAMNNPVVDIAGLLFAGASLMYLVVLPIARATYQPLAAKFSDTLLPSIPLASAIAGATILMLAQLLMEGAADESFPHQLVTEGFEAALSLLVLIFAVELLRKASGWTTRQSFEAVLCAVACLAMLPAGIVLFMLTDADVRRAAVYKVEGQYLLGLNRTDEAMELLESAAELTPDDIDLLIQIGTLHMVARRADLADRYFQQAIDRGDDARAYLGLGGVRMVQGQMGEAAALLERAAEIDPDNEQIWKELGSAYHMLGDLGRATDALRRALALDPHYGEARRSLVNALLDQGDLQSADQELRILVTAQPDDASLYHALGLVNAELGRRQEARRFLEQALERQPDYPEVRALLAELGRG